jgi:hypothetical protein
MNLESEETNLPPQILPCVHENCAICPRWLGYPQSHFPNWTPDQVTRCKIAATITDRRHDCNVYHVDVGDRGIFAPCDERGLCVTKDNERDFWHWLQISVSVYTTLRWLYLSWFTSYIRTDRAVYVCGQFSLRICPALCYKFSEPGEPYLITEAGLSNPETNSAITLNRFSSPRH